MATKAVRKSREQTLRERLKRIEQEYVQPISQAEVDLSARAAVLDESRERLRQKREAAEHQAKVLVAAATFAADDLLGQVKALADLWETKDFVVSGASVCLAERASRAVADAEALRLQIVLLTAERDEARQASRTLRLRLGEVADKGVLPKWLRYAAPLLERAFRDNEGQKGLQVSAEALRAIRRIVRWGAGQDGSGGPAAEMPIVPTVTVPTKATEGVAT